MHLESGGALATLPREFAAQLNDTHPSIAVAELMRAARGRARDRLGHGVGGHRAHLRYTNHTLLPEALEQWPMPLFARAAAAASRDHLRNQPPLSGRGAARAIRGTSDESARLSLIGEAGTKQRAHGPPGERGQPRDQWRRRSCTPICLKRDVLHDFYELWPEKFSNITNGVTPRRWMLLANPALAQTDHRCDRRSLAARPRRVAPARAHVERRGVRRGVARSQAGEQAPSCRQSRHGARAWPSIPTRSSMSR